jgi:nucleoside-diphosphate-sugar epimerase
MKKLLITGGVGFLGYHLCKRLAKKFDKIILVDIDRFNKEEYPSNVDYYRVDISDRFAFEELVKKTKPSLIVHAAAALPLYSEKIIWRVNVQGTKNVLTSALNNKVKRVVFISSTAVYGVPKVHPLYEDTRLVGVGPYGKTKIVAEKICRDFRSKGLCVPIIRPKTFIGTGRLGVFQILYDWVESGKRIPIIGNGKNKYQLLEVEDLVDSIYLTLEKKEELVNDTFNVGAEKYESVYEDVSALCHYADSGARVMKTPATPVKFALRILESLKVSPLYKWVYGTADKDSFVSIEKIQRNLGWKPAFSNQEALIHSYKWYLEHKSESDSATGITHRVAWDQGILKLFKKLL